MLCVQIVYAVVAVECGCPLWKARVCELSICLESIRCCGLWFAMWRSNDRWICVAAALDIYVARRRVVCFGHVMVVPMIAWVGRRNCFQLAFLAYLVIHLPALPGPARPHVTPRHDVPPSMPTCYVSDLLTHCRTGFRGHRYYYVILTSGGVCVTSGWKIRSLFTGILRWWS